KERRRGGRWRVPGTQYLVLDWVPKIPSNRPSQEPLLRTSGDRPPKQRERTGYRVLSNQYSIHGVPRRGAILLFPLRLRELLVAPRGITRRPPRSAPRFPRADSHER